MRSIAGVARAYYTPIRRLAWLLSSIAVIVLADLLVYRTILVPDLPGLYPWASDTLGHLLKAEYLQSNLAQGRLYPDLFPNWYMGIQMLRYYPPLPYFVLVGLAYLTGDMIAAANWFIALCALAGGLSWLLFQRWVGRPLAMLGGVLFLFLPDNVRVALAEGNLPRALASALLPLAIFCLLRALEADGGRRHAAGLSLCFAAIVLCHAMMGAIYAVCSALLVAGCWISRIATFRRAFYAGASVALGIGLSGWWVLPSLSGGITAIDASAMTEALAVVPWSQYLNPFARAAGPETIYVGAVLLAAASAGLWVRHAQRRLVVALVCTGLTGVAITTPGFNALFNALPLHSLFWPLRFLGIASCLLLLAVLCSLHGLRERKPLWIALTIGLLALDGWGSLPAIHLRPPQTDLGAISERLAALPGWREATLDESRFGSTASYLVTARGRREQIYGWAYQGARTAASVAALNEALQQGNTAYLLDRLTLLGVDDVVLLNTLPSADTVAVALHDAGFQADVGGSTATIYHRDGAPRAYLARWPALGIGRGARNLAYLFPQLVVGTSLHVDDYTLDDLRRYQTVVLSGFTWRDRSAAEALVVQAAAAGVRVVVDLTGTTEDPLARAPRFLGVWGEPVVLDAQPVLVQGAGQPQVLQAFGRITGLWHALAPQGMETTTRWFDYLGERAAAVGYTAYGAGQVWFIGLNLPYYAATSQDPTAIAILAEVLGLPPHTPTHYTAVALQGYQADAKGYRFSYRLATPERLIVPIAAHDGTVVAIDGIPVAIHSLEQLIVIEAPAGDHQVAIGFRPTRVYLFGKLVSLLAVLGVIGIAIRWRPSVPASVVQPPALLPLSPPVSSSHNEVPYGPPPTTAP